MQLMFALLVGFGWYYYFTTESLGASVLVVLIVATVVALYKLRRYHVATLAAHNAVAAAATFNTLAVIDQEKVHRHALDIIHKSGWTSSRPPKLEDDAERFGWYALAMAELDIKPICLLNQWNLVRNPFREALNPSYYFQTSTQLAAKQGHEVSLHRPGHRR